VATSPSVLAGQIYTPATNFRWCCAQVVNDGGPPVLSSDGQVADRVQRDEGGMMASLACLIAS
jgi:hypothetical protein